MRYSCVGCWSCCSAFFRAVQPGTSSSYFSLSQGRPTPATLSCSITNTQTDSENSSSRWVTADCTWKTLSTSLITPALNFSSSVNSCHSGYDYNNTSYYNIIKLKHTSWKKSQLFHVREFKNSKNYLMKMVNFIFSLPFCVVVWAHVALWPCLWKE